MKLQRFDRPSAKMIGNHIPSMLASMAAEYGIKIEYAGGRFTESSFTAKIKFVIKPEGRPSWDLADKRQTFAYLCGQYGLRPDHFGGTFHNMRNGDLCRITGINPRSQKYPIEFNVIGTSEQRRCNAHFLKACGDILPPLLATSPVVNAFEEAA